MAKLYFLTSADFQLFHSLNFDKKPQLVNAPNLVSMRWPNGVWCYDANQYLISKFFNRASTHSDGGTLKQYATQLSHVIRFCFDKKRNLDQLVDADFIEFIKLQSNPRPNGQIVTTKTSVSILRRTLEFLDFIGRSRHRSDYVAADGDIKGFKKRIELSKQSHHSQEAAPRWYWDHADMPIESETTTRDSISAIAIDKLRTAATNSNTNFFLMKRRLAMLLVLEITGGRRSEVAELQRSAVYKALAMTQPVLEMRNLKKGGNTYVTRRIRISHSDLRFLKDFIDMNVEPLLAIKKASHDYIFVSARTGQPVRPNTITQEIHHLRNLAGILGRAHPHMFRHRYVTKHLIALIESFKFANESDFRNKLLDLEFFKVQVLDFTGHKSPKSIDPYIKLAYAEHLKIKETLDALHEFKEVDAAKRAIINYSAELQAHGGPKHIVDGLLELSKKFPFLPPPMVPTDE